MTALGQLGNKFKTNFGKGLDKAALGLNAFHTVSSAYQGNWGEAAKGLASTATDIGALAGNYGWCSPRYLGRSLLGRSRGLGSGSGGHGRHLHHRLCGCQRYCRADDSVALDRIKAGPATLSRLRETSETRTRPAVKPAPNFLARRRAKWRSLTLPP